MVRHHLFAILSNSADEREGDKGWGSPKDKFYPDMSTLGCK